uniref:Uncharacterized protein n=1 Tax=Meloidogyne incognita TaxID=6306 RepID=A0A914KSR2_MELIC
MSSTIPSRPAITKRSLFKEKVIVCREVLEKVHADCFINFCCPDSSFRVYESIQRLSIHLRFMSHIKVYVFRRMHKLLI